MLNMGACKRENDQNLGNILCPTSQEPRHEVLSFPNMYAQAIGNRPRNGLRIYNASPMLQPRLEEVSMAGG